MTKDPSPARAGARTGAILGALSRPAVVCAFWLNAQSRADTWLTVPVSSCLLGLLLGRIVGSVAGSAGAWRPPVTGPLIGALVGSDVWFASSVLTLTCLCLMTATDDIRSAPVDNIQLYWITMAIIGAIPGLGGGLAADRVRRELADRGPADAGTEIGPPDPATSAGRRPTA
jgi:hypothetical protein